MPPAQDTLADSIRNIPPVTRFFTITTMIVCFANSLNIINPHHMMCYLPLLVERFEYASGMFKSGGYLQMVSAVAYLLFQTHRFFTAFLLPVGILVGQPFQAILDIYFFYTFANHCESYQGKFHGNFPDCLWFTLVTGTIIVFSSLAYNAFIDANHFPIHHQMMLSCVTYIWSRSLKNSLINFLGLVPIKAYYLPLFNLFFKLMVNGYSSFVDTSIGIFGGYLYQCIQSDTLPIYNLYPGAYSAFLSSNNNRAGRRVGTLFQNVETSNNSSSNVAGFGDNNIDDSIFDKGYLKAPLWLYKLLNYPINSSQRTTAFYPRQQFVTGGGGVTVNAPSTSTAAGSRARSSASLGNDEHSMGHSSGFSWFGEKNAFKGKGHRLGD